MSAPDTNVKKQSRRHWPAITAITLALVFAFGLVIWWVVRESVDPEPVATPGEAPVPEATQTTPPGALPDAAPQPDPVSPVSPQTGQ
ncbi:hypothetical protein [Ketogulonicigenium vulgare]|uniref:Uncharacterized protein n=1 Tax=Ketogulonicigenium vulgare (strain WSH-001) TaxID=759362 RepID=F9Y915_KETVW|nr:hypothetical protein [Ketogulonicigenium vulgare]ADO41847.1 hypothetical protein EIO_0688 [Ketogulonicigenium vulgare Y25]AEM40071.1 hypothetical protein KVU_0232 [Ketogulonicigenium vulgare WSH-001]ALJ80275.1 hypothetical protein KVH_03240 [Ketogulonicigenium vulgare]ANW34905.1 hypothetical protein KvSKV_03235 [Ketogulonicigenium vulgare]AOZ53770.1 hypothetical protein KVC_0750 [Ketogulonicigenium vulgare]